MTQDKNKIIFGFFLCLVSLCLVSGCIRLTGRAGYWKQGSEDEAPKVKQVGFDTADLTGQLPPEANITEEES